MPNLDADRFLEDMSGRYAAPYADAIGAMVVAMTRGNKHALSDARKRLERVTSETMALGEIFGASLLMRDASTAYVEEGVELARDRAGLLTFAATETKLAGVTFDEAVADMLARTPLTLRRAAERTAQRVAQLYSEGKVVAFARSAEQSVTKRVQSLIAEALREGSIATPGGGVLVGDGSIGRGISMAVDEIREKTDAWTDAYSRMVFRTNMNTATSAGRFRQAQDPDIKEVLPAFRYDAVGDSDTRPEHAALDGLILSVDNEAWNWLAPPIDYNCRCEAVQMSLPQLRRMGRIGADDKVIQDRPPKNLKISTTFRHGPRPDLFIVAVSG